MITSAEVGSIFTIEDRATAVLNTIADAADRVAESAKVATDALAVMADTAPFAGLLTEIESMTEGMNAFGASAARESSVMVDGFGVATGQVQVLRAEVMALTEQLGAMGAARAAATAETLGGGLAGKAFSLPALAAEFTAFEAVKSGMNMEDTINRMMMAMNMKVGSDFMNTDMAMQIQSQIESHSRAWGIPLIDMQHAAMAGARNLAPLSPEQRMKIMPSLLDFVGAEVTGKPGTTAEEAASAGIGLAHQLKDYTPEQIEPIFKVFAQLSRGTEATLPNLSKQFSYALPLLTSGLNMDPTELMAMGVAGSQMGLGSKSGTWLSAMFATPFTADLTTKRQSQRRDALEELGLFHDGKATTTDPFKFIETMAEKVADIPQEKRLQLFMHAFGLQGAREAAIMTDPAVLRNLMGLAQQIKTAPSADELKEGYGESPLFKFHQAESEFSIALTALGESVMPAATVAIKAFIEVMKGLTWIFSPGATAEAIRKQKETVGTFKDSMAKDEDSPLQSMWKYFQSSSSPSLPAAKNAGGTNVAAAMRTGAQAPAFVVNGGINLYGAPTDSPADFANNFISALNKRMGQSALNNLGAGEGSYYSPFTNAINY